MRFRRITRKIFSGFAVVKFSTTAVLSLALALIFVPSTTLAFSDIESHANETAIRYLYANGVIDGYPDGTFKPDKTVNRAELLKILIGGKGIIPTVNEYNNCFPDVADDWYAPWVCYAKQQNWIEGYPDGTFKPGREVNKVEAIKMLIGSQEYIIPGLITPDFKTVYDDVSGDEWFSVYLVVALDKGLLEVTSGNYNPAGSKTRASVSENIYRAMLLKLDGPYEVVSVTDGDTIKVDIDGELTPVRLIGINAPESGQAFYAESKAKLDDLVSNKSVRLEKDLTNIDDFGRLLRYVFEGHTFVNEQMVISGLATAKDYEPDTKYSEILHSAETDAINEQLAIWATGDSQISVYTFNYDAAGNDNENLNNEYVTLINDGTSQIDMTGWTMQDDANHTFYFPAFKLDPAKKVTIYTGTGKNTQNELYWNNTGTAIWNNGGDVLYLRNAKGELVLEEGY
jgi:micrococcal nuclease